MANLSVEEPDALMCARPDLWEPWAGNCPGPPGPPQVGDLRLDAEIDVTDARKQARRRHSNDIASGCLICFPFDQLIAFCFQGCVFQIGTLQDSADVGVTVMVLCMSERFLIG